MTKRRRTAGVILALVLLFTMRIPAFAADNGSITVNNAVVGQTYGIYRIFDLESYDAQKGLYAYKASATWEEWLRTQTAYIEVDAQGYITWIAGEDEGQRNAAAAEFAKAALAYAKEQSIAPDYEQVTATSEDPEAETAQIAFTGLKLGYYLLDSTLGTLCSLNTTRPSVTISEKNVKPGIEKQVEEDATGIYGASNHADIGQTIHYQSTITAQAGAQNYVVHDKMDPGLTYTKDSVSVKLISDSTESLVTAENYTVTDANLADGCTFEVSFQKEFCDTLKANDQLIISYEGVLNEDAVIAGDGNVNEAKLSYGDSSNIKTTPPVTTVTYTFDVKLLKYTMNESAEVPLDGVVFSLSKNEDGREPFSFSLATDPQGDVTGTYRVDPQGDVTQITTDESGYFKFIGLDSDTYYLTEISAPGGYNKLAAPVKIVIDTGGNINATEEEPEGVDVIKILNEFGIILPSTGGVGTTAFYIIGVVLVLGSTILLITRKRMEQQNC